MTEARFDQRLLAISHSDRVDIYGYGPGTIQQYNAIAAHSPAGDVLAEQIVEMECKKPLYPHATFGKFGKIGTVTQRSVSAAEYAYHQAMADNVKLLEDIGNGEASDE